jgi:hypothetical protein
MSINFYDEEPRTLKIHNNEQNITTDLLKLFSFIYYNKIPLLKNNKIRKNNYTKILKNFVLIREPEYLDFLLDFSLSNKFLVHTGNFWDIDYAKIIGFLDRTDHAFVSIFEFMEEKFKADKKIKIILSVLRELPAGKWMNFEKFYKYLITQSKSFIDPPTFFKNKYYANKQTCSNKQITENIFAHELFWTGTVKVSFNKQPNPISRNSTHDEVLSAITRIVQNNSLNPEQLSELPGLDVERLREIYDELYNLTKLDYNLHNFMLTPVGKALLNNRRNVPQFFPRKVSKFTIQPNFEIIIPPNFDEKKYFKLLSFIETIKTETLNTFKITKQSIYNAILDGVKQKDLERFLASNSGVRIPKNVLDLINDCYSQFNKIELYRNQYILKASKLIIKKIEHDPELVGFIQDKLNSETLLLQHRLNIHKLINKYKSLGLKIEIRST